MSFAGHRVRVLDIDGGRISSLREGAIPFLEPDLPALLAAGRTTRLLSFHTDPAEAVPGADIVFVCVGTLNGPEGDVDLSGVLAATSVVATHATPGTVLVNRSTAPVGTAQYIRTVLEDLGAVGIAVAVNPEFLAEGTAVRNFLLPDRIVIGAEEARAIDRLLEAYAPIVQRVSLPNAPAEIRDAIEARSDPVPTVVTSTRTAELAKYAANAMLAVKISFINEIASIAEELGGDVTEVARAVGLDHRIGRHFLGAGIGWGGSCFPKDILALQGMAETHGLAARMLRAANEVNLEQRRWVVRKLQRHLKTLHGRRVGLLGLAFKPNTDDLRDAPALEIAADLARLNVRVRAYDPAVDALAGELAQRVEVVDSVEAAARGADALVVVTDWPEFADLDLVTLREGMRIPLLLDGRNVFDPDATRAAGFVHVGVGRPEQGAFELITNNGSGGIRAPSAQTITSPA
jgi:UDPglucose 6-dehydrogenase